MGGAGFSFATLAHSSQNERPSSSSVAELTDSVLFRWWVDPGGVVWEAGRCDHEGCGCCFVAAILLHMEEDCGDGTHCEGGRKRQLKAKRL